MGSLLNPVTLSKICGDTRICFSRASSCFKMAEQRWGMKMEVGFGWRLLSVDWESIKADLGTHGH